MTNREWLYTLHRVTDTLKMNCACSVSKCGVFSSCNECVEKWLDSEHGQDSMYSLAEENDKILYGETQ